MNTVSIGDLAQTFQNRRRSVQIKSDLARLAQELSSGKKSDLSTVSGGGFAPLVGLQRSLKANLAYATSIAEAGLVVSAKQTSLELVQGISTDIGSALLSAGTSEQPMLIQITTADAATKFETAVSAFNTRVADRYVFSGAATDRPALADAGVILAALQSAVASETTAAGIVAVVDAWFDDAGGGFETGGYTGSNTAVAPIRLSDTETASLGLTAADPEIRSVLKGFAMAALVGDGALAGNTAERAAITRAAGERVLNANFTLAVVRGKVGSGEAQIDGALARNSAEKSAIEIAITELTAIDPYRTASELEAVKSQLETIYTLTVRLSRLSLSEYLR